MRDLLPTDLTVQPLNQFGVSTGDLLAQLKLIRIDFQFFQQDCGLDRVQSSVHADPHVVVFVDAFAVDADRFNSGSQFFIVGEYGSSVSIATQGFRREKTCRPNLPVQLVLDGRRQWHQTIVPHPESRTDPVQQRSH